MLVRTRFRARARARATRVRVRVRVKVRVRVRLGLGLGLGLKLGLGLQPCEQKARVFPRENDDVVDLTCSTNDSLEADSSLANGNGTVEGVVGMRVRDV